MSTISVRSPRAAATSQNVTLPPIPELFDPNFLDVLIPPQAASEPKDDGEVASIPPKDMADAPQFSSNRKLTTKGAPAFDSTGIPTLDAFIGLRMGIFGQMVDQYLTNAWKEDSELTLRIIWNTRSIHDGKGEKELFYRAFGWLFETHPRTAISNIHLLVEPVCLRSTKVKGKKRQGGSHGYWKDLLNILAMATLDQLRPKSLYRRRSTFLHNYYDGKSRPDFKNNEEQEEWSRVQRIKRSQLAHERLTQKLVNDKHYRALYVSVARLFANQLAKDFDTMEKISSLPGDVDKQARTSLMFALTLAPKWAPTPGGAHDRVTNIASAICLLLSEAQVCPSVASRIATSPVATLPALDLHILRCFYQKQILTRGRRLLCTPEPLMSSNRWSKIVYSRVPSICMNKNSLNFLTHDEKRFEKYVQDVFAGRKCISGATLLPHVLVREAVQLQLKREQESLHFLSGVVGNRRQIKLADAQIRVVDAQWKTLVYRLRESGQLDNCIAICDVSGSMGSIKEPTVTIGQGNSSFNVHPIWPAVSLSLLVARLAKPPFNDAFITFSLKPQLVTIQPEWTRQSLGETVLEMGRADWGRSTNFNAVFLDLILPLAVKHKVPQEDMIKRVFVFSDMQFDESADIDGKLKHTPKEWLQQKWKTNHDVIAQAYEEAGYDVPELVYWDLSDPRDGRGITAPVTGEREGVVLLSGYSPSLLKVFMDDEGEDWEVVDQGGQVVRQPITPEEFMKKALGRKSFDGLRVID